MENFIEGKNAVIEALRSDRQIEKIFLVHEEPKIIALAKQNGIIVQKVPKSKLDEMSETNKHQGIGAIIAPVKYLEIDDVLKLAREKDEPPFIVVLDHIEDPHNLGAIIRTAEAAGAHGVVIPNRRAAGVTAIAEKAAAGAVSHIPIVKVSNIGACIDRLKSEGVWIYCASQDGEPLFNQDMSGAVAIVIGSEGEGVGALTSKKCDFHVTIPMLGKISSLNASVAAGIVLYEVVRRRLGRM